MNPIILNDIKEILADSSIDWSGFKEKNVLVTGANGMLPSYLVYTLLYLNKVCQYNIGIYALVRNEERAKLKFAELEDIFGLHLIVQDVSQPIKIEDDIHYIIHAASQASPKYYGVDPVGTINANVLGTINTLNLAREKNVEGYLFFSSGDVYGVVSPDKFPFTERDYGYIDLLKEHSCYGESKRMGEQLCVAYDRQYNVPTKIARIFHTYGPEMQADDGRVFADFCYSIARNENIILKSDGQAKRLFCYITDATRAFFKILLSGKRAEAYNMANPNGLISIVELANMLVKLYPEKKLKVIFDIQGGKEDKSIIKSPIICAIPQCENLIKLGWSPNVSIEEGFKRVIEKLSND